MPSWVVKDDGIEFKGTTMPYDKISNIRLVTGASVMTNGVIQFVYEGKVVTVSYSFKQRDTAQQALQFIKDKVSEASGVKDNFKYRLVAHTGTVLRVYDDYLILNHMRSGSTVSNIIGGGSSGDKKILFSDLTAIQFREPAGYSVGFMQFIYPGSSESKANVLDAINDENSIPFQPSELENARTIYNYIEERRHDLSSRQGAHVIQQLSSADEIKKFKELLDLGIITQEEFDAKKKQLLGLPQQPVTTPSQTPATSNSISIEKEEEVEAEVVPIIEENGNIKCPKCGTEQKSGRNVCYRCGTSFTQS